MKIIKKFQFIGLIILMTALALFPSQVYAQNLFSEYQSIPTRGAEDWESFTIGSDTFLAVANSYNGYTHNIDSKIYKWNGSSFVEFQSISTQGASNWESFTIGSDTFLAVAISYNGYTHNIDSKIYKWNGSALVEFQSIPTQRAYDWESFTIGSDTFLAVANASNGSTYNIASKIYKWNGSSFVEFQSIPTQRAFDWESFTIGSDTFLAVANSFNGSTYNIASKIYKWNGSAFVKFKSIPTQDAFDWESFTIGSDTFLAVANSYNGSTVNIDSKIYKNLFVKDMNLDAGWHMISLPIEPESLVLSDIFPGAVVVYRYERNAGYVRVQPHEELEVGKGYWILLNQATSYTIFGYPIKSYTHAADEDGWAIIGGCTDPAKVFPSGCNIGVIYRYVQGFGYQRVLTSEYLEPGEGCWILLNNLDAGATITVEVD